MKLTNGYFIDNVFLVGLAANRSKEDCFIAQIELPIAYHEPSKEYFTYRQNPTNPWSRDQLYLAQRRSMKLLWLPPEKTIAATPGIHGMRVPKGLVEIVGSEQVSLIPEQYDPTILLSFDTVSNLKKVLQGWFNTLLEQVDSDLTNTLNLNQQFDSVKLRYLTSLSDTPDKREDCAIREFLSGCRPLNDQVIQNYVQWKQRIEGDTTYNQRSLLKKIGSLKSMLTRRH